MKAWLKGGLIFGGIALIIRVITFIFDSMFLWKAQKFLMPFYYEYLIPDLMLSFKMILQYILSTVIFVAYLFIVGALIAILIDWIIKR